MKCAIFPEILLFAGDDDDDDDDDDGRINFNVAYSTKTARTRNS